MLPVIPQANYLAKLESHLYSSQNCQSQVIKLFTRLSAGINDFLVLFTVSFLLTRFLRSRCNELFWILQLFKCQIQEVGLRIVFAGMVGDMTHLIGGVGGELKPIAFLTQVHNEADPVVVGCELRQ